MELFIALCIVFWAVTLVMLCGRRDIEIHSKLSWVVTLLVLNAVGALLYLFFAPKRRQVPQVPEVPPVEPEGMAWSPILGYNRFAEGEGLNPGKQTQPGEPPEATG
jgi:hypothetical protein